MSKSSTRLQILHTFTCSGSSTGPKLGKIVEYLSCHWLIRTEWVAYKPDNQIELVDVLLKQQPRRDPLAADWVQRDARKKIVLVDAYSDV